MTTFTLDETTYKITKTQLVGDDLANLRDSLLSNGKEAVIYYASKVLKSGKVSSKQGGMFYKFSNSGKMIKVI
jgi:serine/threonine-protein kinase RIO1